MRVDVLCWLMYCAGMLRSQNDEILNNLMEKYMVTRDESLELGGFSSLEQHHAYSFTYSSMASNYNHHPSILLVKITKYDALSKRIAVCVLPLGFFLKSTRVCLSL